MHKDKQRILIIVFLFLTIFLSWFLYRDSFSAYFFQDDWFTIKISQAQNISEFLSFFIPRTDVIYYRPLGMQVPFFILQNLFGVNALPFHLLTLITHMINIFLVFYLIRLLSNNIFVSLLSSFLYGTSLTHYIPFFWSATYSFVLGPTLFYLTFILYLKGKIKQSILCFILGMLTNEIVIILPFVLLMYELLFRRNKKLLSQSVNFLLIGGLIFFIRLIIFPPPIMGDYKIELGSYLINSLKAYFLWSFNWPEEMKAQFVSFFGINSQFTREFAFYLRIFMVSLFVNVILFYFGPTLMMIYNRRFRYLKRIIFGMIWFIVGLSPVLLFPKHTFSYYLPISLVGLFYLSATLFKYLVDALPNKLKYIALFPIFILLVNWTIVSFYAIEFNYHVHWAPRRAKLAEKLIGRVYAYYPYRGYDYPVVYIDPFSENKLALNDQDALRVVYNDERMLTIYKHKPGKRAI